jgi:hypothetical protein
MNAFIAVPFLMSPETCVAQPVVLGSGWDARIADAKRARKIIDHATRR